MKVLTTLILLLFIALKANAHVPFLKPNLFNIPYDRLQIESSFTENPFQADFKMESPFFYLINSKGEKTTILPTAKTVAAVYLEPKITKEGTYRIHSSFRKGPKYNAIETPDGKLYFSKEIKNKQGKMTKLQYFSSADTYVTKGVSDYQPNVVNSGIEIVPITSPNSILVNDKATFKVYDNGKPIPNARVVVAYDNERYNKKLTSDYYDVENQRKSNIYTNNDGVFTFIPKKAGLVLLFVTIHKKIDDLLTQSYNTSLTLEINLP